MQIIPTAIWIGQNHRWVVAECNLSIPLNHPATVLLVLFSSCHSI
jgi:hypothetical protein